MASAQATYSTAIPAPGPVTTMPPSTPEKDPVGARAGSRMCSARGPAIRAATALTTCTTRALAAKTRPCCVGSIWVIQMAVSELPNRGKLSDEQNCAGTQIWGDRPRPKTVLLSPAPIKPASMALTLCFGPPQALRMIAPATPPMPAAAAVLASTWALPLERAKIIGS